MQEKLWNVLKSTIIVRPTKKVVIVILKSTIIVWPTKKIVIVISFTAWAEGLVSKEGLLLVKGEESNYFVLNCVTILKQEQKHRQLLCKRLTR